MCYVRGTFLVIAVYTQNAAPRTEPYGTRPVIRNHPIGIVTRHQFPAPPSVLHLITYIQYRGGGATASGAADRDPERATERCTRSSTPFNLTFVNLNISQFNT